MSHATPGQGTSGFQLFARPDLGRGAEEHPALRIGHGGVLVLNAAASSALASSRALLLVDLEEHRIALRPTTAEDLDSYSVQNNGSSGSAISARAFVRHAHLAVGTKLVLTVEDGMLTSSTYTPSED